MAFLKTGDGGIGASLKSINVSGTTTASGNLPYVFSVGIPICCVNNSNDGKVIEPYSANGEVAGFRVLTNGGNPVASTAVSLTVYYI